MAPPVVDTAVLVAAAVIVFAVVAGTAVSRLLLFA
jgi:hypothetical protein